MSFSGSDVPTQSSLGQNEPNPFGSSTVIKYNVAENTDNAYIQVMDVAGKQVKMIPVKAGKGQVELNFSEFNLQVMFYSLYVNNSLVDTKKMVKQVK